MREICKSGSEGGAGQTNVPFLPLLVSPKAFSLWYKQLYRVIRGSFKSMPVSGGLLPKKSKITAAAKVGGDGDLLRWV